MDTAGKSYGSVPEMRQMNGPLETNEKALQINANKSNIYLNSTINYIEKNKIKNAQPPAPDESKLSYIMENRHGEAVDVKIKVLEIVEPAGRKQRSKTQFRGSFKVADETAYTTLKVFGPHKNEIMQLFRPKQQLILKRVKVNADFLSFTSYSTVIKSITRVTIPETTRSQMKEEEENDLMTPEQITLFQGISAKTKVFVEKVGMQDRTTLRKKYQKKSKTVAKPVRYLTVKGGEGMRPFQLTLWDKLATRSYEEGKFYIFTKVKYNEEHENLTTVENCRVIRCPEPQDG